MKFSSKNAQIMMNDIIKALKEIEKKHDIKIVQRGGNIHDHGFMAKIEIRNVAEDGTVQTKETGDLQAYYPEFVGKSIKDRDQTLEIIGYRTRASKNKFQLRDNKGKTFVAPHDFVTRNLIAA